MASNQSNKFGIASLVLGIISIVIEGAYVSFFFLHIKYRMELIGTGAVLFGLPGIILASMQLKKHKNIIAVAGLIASIIGMLIPLVFSLFIISIIFLFAAAVRG